MRARYDWSKAGDGHLERLPAGGRRFQMNSLESSCSAGCAHALGWCAKLMPTKKTFQCRNVSLIFLALHLPLEIKHMTQANKWQAIYNIRLRDLLSDRRLARLF